MATAASFPESSRLVLLCLFLLLLHPAFGRSRQLRGAAINERPYKDRVFSEEAGQHHLWTRDRRNRGNIFEYGGGNAERNGGSFRKGFLPKYGRRHDTVNKSLDNSTAFDRHYAPYADTVLQPSIDAVQDRNNYYYDDDMTRHVDSYRGKPCGNSKGKKKNRVNQKEQYEDIISRSQSKGKGLTEAGSTRSRKTWGKRKSKGKGETSGCKDLEDPNVEKIACSTDVREFESSLAALFNGEPQLLSTAEQVALETSFQETYNELTYASCDGYFRRVESVSLSVGAQGRRLQISNAAGYKVTGTCRKCPVADSGSFQLFDDSFRRRNLQFTSPVIEVNIPNSNAGSTQTEVCTCPLQAEERRLQIEQGLEPKAPSEAEFLIAYNNAIDRLVQDGIITNINSIQQLEETALREETTMGPQETDLPETTGPTTPPTEKATPATNRPSPAAPMEPIMPSIPPKSMMPTPQMMTMRPTPQMSTLPTPKMAPPPSLGNQMTGSTPPT